MTFAPMSIGDWIAAATNLALAASIIIGGLVALRRWNVVFAVRLPEGPSHGESGSPGMPVIRTTSWHCKLTLAEGKVAHIARIKLQRRNEFGLWQREKQATFPHVYMPISLLSGDTFEFTISIVKGTSGPFRLKIDEYSTMRCGFVPFVEPERENDFS